MFKDAALLGSLVFSFVTGFCFAALPEPDKGVWSAPINGLAISMRIPNDRLPAENNVNIQLGFRNVSDKPIRIYLVQGYFFRSFQCMFFL